MIALRNILAPLLLCVAATASVDPAYAQDGAVQVGLASSQLASAEAILGTRSLAELNLADLRKIKAILDRIVKDDPGSDMAAHILLEDKVGTIDVATLDRQVATMTSGGKPKLQKSAATQAVDAALAAVMETPSRAVPMVMATDTVGLLSVLKSTWIIDPGAPSADVSVTVDFSLTPDGKVVPASIKLVSAQGGGQAAEKEAYRKARMAILRGSDLGFGLPLSKYQEWRNIEMVFDPQGMKLQ